MPVRLATPRNCAADDAWDLEDCDLDDWVEWVPIGKEAIPDLDGVYLLAPDDYDDEYDDAQALSTRYPEVPLLDERSPTGRPDRAAFLEAVFARNRWRARDRVGRSLVEFHEAHELLLRGHGEEGAAELAELARAPAPAEDAYGRGLLRHLARPTSRDGALSILRVALARLRPRLAPRDRRALRLAVQDFGRGTLPLVAPRTLLRHHAARCGDERLVNQLFLDPYPAELEYPRVERTDDPA